MKKMLAFLFVVLVCLNSGPTESVKPILEPKRMTGMNGNEKC